MNIRLRVTVLLALVLSAFQVLAEVYQTHEAIYDAARDLVEQSLTINAEHEITFALMDPHLNLSICEQPLQAFLATATIKPGRNSIGVRCPGLKPWSLFVSAQVKVFQDVVVLTQSVKRGEILTANQVQLMRMDTSSLKSAVIHDLNAAIDKQAAHNLSQDAILSDHDITQAVIIKRGENVAITSGNPNLSIQMQGTALMDGIQGQSIRVKNTASGRVIFATVTKVGVVAVGL